MKRLSQFFSVIGLLLVVISFPLIARALYALSSTYVVDRLTDNNPTGGGDGTGLTGDLRYAITNAQSGDSITFSIVGTIHLVSSLPSLTHNITIAGPGANQLTIDGAGGNVLAVGSGTTAMISGLTITGGAGNGGGVFNAGTLTLNSVAVSGNQAGDPTNGGGTGAGIWNNVNATLTLNNSTVNNNIVLGSSFYNPSRGGGIANYGILTINNSTISGNSASEGGGGGISNTLPTSILTLHNSTVSNNAATGVVGVGGGIDNHGTLNAVNTIIAGNTGGQAPDLFGPFGSQGHNLIGNTNGGSGFRPDLGDLLNVNPLLGFLQSNGGSTETMAPLVGSPAIDAGEDTACAASPINNLDQRGVTRPQGAHCDIGAYEGSVSSSNTVTPSATSTATQTATNTPTTTATSTPTNTPTATPTNTPTSTLTSTPTDTPTNTPTDTPTNTSTNTPTNTATGTPTNTATNTPTNTSTNTATSTPFSNTPGKVTGGGAIGSEEDDVRATFGLTIKYNEGDSAPKGNLTYQDHETHLRLKAISFDLLVIEDHHAWFTGRGIVNNGEVVRFRVDLYALSQPDSPDMFYMSIPTMNGYTVGGALTGGNITIH